MAKAASHRQDRWGTTRDRGRATWNPLPPQHKAGRSSGRGGGGLWHTQPTKHTFGGFLRGLFRG